MENAQFPLHYTQKSSLGSDVNGKCLLFNAQSVFY